jgi:hypothetical protein
MKSVENDETMRRDERLDMNVTWWTGERRVARVGRVRPFAPVSAPIVADHLATTRATRRRHAARTSDGRLTSMSQMRHRPILTGIGA